MGNALKKLFVVSISVVIGVIVVYGLITVYGNYKMTTSPYSPPSVEKAQYSVKIGNTGLTFFSDSVETTGNIVLMRGYWELQKDNKHFKYRADHLILSKDIFGPITVKLRQ